MDKNLPKTFGTVALFSSDEWLSLTGTLAQNGAEYSFKVKSSGETGIVMTRRVNGGLGLGYLPEFNYSLK